MFSSSRVTSGVSEPGILYPSLSRHKFDYQRHVPDRLLATFVENFWTVTWQLAPGEAFTAQVLPYPSVNCSVTHEGADVTGVTRRRYDRHLVGSGYAVGARFRPGCFRPFIAYSTSRLTDTARPMADVFGRSTFTLQESVAATFSLAERVRLLTDFLLEDVPAANRQADWVGSLVAEVAARADIIRVSQLALIAEVSERRLHRLFVDFVGAPPKWVIARCRLQDAAARAAEDPEVDWGSLAIELGFADQAHLTRAFSRVIGAPPAAYVARMKSLP